VAVLKPAEPNPWGEQIEEIFVTNERGTSYFTSLGYEIRVVSRVAAGVAVSFIHQSIGGDIFDDAVIWPATMIPNWN
jgi:hypothetical protein